MLCKLNKREREGIYMGYEIKTLKNAEGQRLNKRNYLWKVVNIFIFEWDENIIKIVPFN